MSLVTWPSSRNMVMLSSVPALTSKSIGSETTSAPFGIVKDGEPLNVNVFRVLVSIAGMPGTPPNGRAMVTAVMGRSVMPNAFDMRRRMWGEVAVT